MSELRLTILNRTERSNVGTNRSKESASGRDEVNACAKQCPGRLRFVGFLDNPESAVHKLVHVHKVALGLFPEKGREPNVSTFPGLDGGSSRNHATVDLSLADDLRICTEPSPPES